MKIPATMNEATSRNGILSNLTDIFRNNIREYGMLIALIAVMIFFQIRTDGILMKPVNITNLVLQNSYVIIMALGMLLIIVSGWIDLSVGSVAAFVGAIAGVMMVKWGWNWALTILLCLIVGGLIGAWQGYWVAYRYSCGHVDLPRAYSGHGPR
jgi:putative multiple sugar transport system permease protein